MESVGQKTIFPTAVKKSGGSAKIVGMNGKLLSGREIKVVGAKSVEKRNEMFERLYLKRYNGYNRHW